MVSRNGKRPAMACDFGVCEDVCLCAAAVLDFDFNVERWDACEDDGDGLFTLVFDLAEAICATRVRETSRGSSIDFLLDDDGSEGFLLLRVVLIFEPDEFICIFAGTTGI